MASKTFLLRLDADDGSDFATGGSRPLALVEGGPPPTEYLMFAPGVNETVKGPLLFDDEAAAAVMEFYQSRGRERLAGDWEHDSMVPADLRPANYKGSPASHWFRLEVRPGPELWAVDVKWTPTAFAQIQAGEYAHTSPVVKFDRKTERITAILSSALTNDPATIGQPQLVAATADSTAILSEPAPPEAASTKDESMAYRMNSDAAMKMKSLIDGEHADEKEMAGKLRACLAESLPAHFGEDKAKAGENGNAAMSENPADAAAKLDVDPGNLPQNAAVHIKTGNIHDEGGRKNAAVTDEEKREMTAWFDDRGALFRHVATLTGKSTVAEMTAALTGIKMQAEETATLSAAVAERSDAAFDAVLAKARGDKKLTPADCAIGSKTKRGIYISTLRANRETGVLALKAFLDPLGPVVTTAETVTTEPKGATPSVVALSAAEEQSIARNGLDRAAYIKNKQDRVASGDGFRA